MFRVADLEKNTEKYYKFTGAVWGFYYFEIQGFRRCKSIKDKGLKTKGKPQI